jgi:hypothetical protein
MLDPATIAIYDKMPLEAADVPLEAADVPLEAADTMPQAVRVCRSNMQYLKSNLPKLAEAFDMHSDDAASLGRMFCQKRAFVPVFTAEFQCEFAFSCWGFVKDDNARRLLLKVMLLCMNPRVYMVSETLSGHHVEVMMIVKLEKLCMSRAQFEQWLEAFLEKLRMSAGLVVFQQYLGEQMISCMQRIEKGANLRSNIAITWNRDFLLLYNNLLQKRADATRVKEFTKLEFTVDNFINMFVQNMLRQDGLISANTQLRRLDESEIGVQILETQFHPVRHSRRQVIRILTRPPTPTMDT